MLLDPRAAQASVEQGIHASGLPGKIAYSTAGGPPFWIRTISRDPVPASPAGISLQTAIVNNKKHPKIVWQPNRENDIATYRLYRYTCPGANCYCNTTPVCIAILDAATTAYIDPTYVLWQKGPRSTIPHSCVHYTVRAVDLIGQVSAASSGVKVYANENLEASGDGDALDKHSVETGPAEFGLESNYPNPFNPSTTIRFSVPRETHVTIKVYDVLGREVATLADEMMAADWHERVFDGRAVPSGLYYCRMNAGSFNAIRKLLLLK
jgi:hypothetical protein